MNCETDPEMFERFHKALTSERAGYTPWYFLLSKGMKDPVAGISWKQLEGRLTFEQAIRKMRAGHNIGIAATGMDALCIVDVDDIEATPDEIVKPTLSTRSRKRIGRHYFYFTDDPRCKENLPTENKGEIRSSFEYVVAPGSFVICNDETMAAMPEAQRERAGRYTVENERAPDTIRFEELPPVFLEQAKKNQEIAKEAQEKRKAKAKARKDKKPTQGSDKNKSAMWDLSMDDVTSIPNKARFSSLFHESTTGKNTALNSEGGLTCWRHLVTHTPLSALAVLAGVADCNSAGKGINNGKSSIIDYSDGMTLWKMWSFAKREGMIPKDDPIPAAAVRWYAVDNGICKHNEITDGWKLPKQAYKQAIALIETKEKMSTGRGVTGKVRGGEQKAEIKGQYEILKFELFRKLSARYPDSDIKMVEGTGSDAIYAITGDDFINDALDLEAIIPFTNDDGKGILLTTPEQLHAFIGRVEARLDGENTIYCVSVRGEQIDFSAEEIIDITIWRKKALYKCKMVISFDLRKTTIRDTFNLMIVDILDRAEVVWEEEYSIDDMYAQMIMTEVDKLIEVDVRAAFCRNPAAILLEDGMRLVKSSTIASIHERLRIPHGLEKIRGILNSHLAESSKQLMIDKKRYSCWVFKGGEADD